MRSKSERGAKPVSMADSNQCNIVPAGKRRDGKMRYWCIEHKGDATAKYGVQAPRCRNADQEPIAPTDILEFDIDQYKGGIALWGAVPAIYDTTRLPMDRGIHVHARKQTGASKEIDRTYRAVRVFGEAFPETGVVITELESIYYMVSSVFGFETKLVLCTYCRYPHLDKDFFSVNPHRRHLCAGCGKHFFDSERGIGNPISLLQAASGIPARPPVSANRAIEISQKDFPGGVQIWGSNAALLWTSDLQEEEGIHLHAFKTDGYGPTIDDTYSSVTVDGIHLDAVQVRVLMAQQSMPSLSGRIVSLTCDHCGRDAFELSRTAFSVEVEQLCAGCGAALKAKGRYRKVVANPVVRLLAELEKCAIRSIQKHSLGFRPEVL